MRSSISVKITDVFTNQVFNRIHSDFQLIIYISNPLDITITSLEMQINERKQNKMGRSKSNLEKEITTS